MNTPFKLSDNNDLNASKRLFYLISKLVTLINLFFFKYFQGKNKLNRYDTQNRMTDEFLLDFEKFVSEQEYSISKLIVFCLVFKPSPRKKGWYAVLH